MTSVAGRRIALVVDTGTPNGNHEYLGMAVPFFRVYAIAHRKIDPFDLVSR